MKNALKITKKILKNILIVLFIVAFPVLMANIIFEDGRYTGLMGAFVLIVSAPVYWGASVYFWTRQHWLGWRVTTVGFLLLYAYVAKNTGLGWWWDALEIVCDWFSVQDYCFFGGMVGFFLLPVIAGILVQRKALQTRKN